MKKLLLGCVLAVFLSGCAGKTVSVWEKPGATPAQEKQDYAECMFEANKHSQEGLLSEEAKQQRIEKLRDLCFEAKGYKLISREFKPGN